MKTLGSIFSFLFVGLITGHLSTVHAGEDDLYDFLWLDPDKSVHVLQNKLYPKKKRYYIDLGYGTSTSAVFQDTNLSQLKFGYSFTEKWGIELGYGVYSNLDNSTHEGVKFTSGTVPYVIRPKESLSAYLTYSPFYGKINTFNKIYYFDWTFSLGTGSLTMQSNLDSVLNSSAANTFNDVQVTPINLKTGLKFHINESYYLQMEYINTNFEAVTPKNSSTKSWQSNSDLIFSFGLSF